MQNYQIGSADIMEFKQYLNAAEKAPGTVEKYVRDVSRFADWLGIHTVSKERVTEWKERLAAEGYAPATIKLVRKLKKYARKQKIVSGELFLTRNGQSISRKQIWAEMKSLCRLAGVEESKVFPHNLRHLFARAFYHVCRDIARQADILGHSNIETTRIYLLTTGAEYRCWLDHLELIP